MINVDGNTQIGWKIVSQLPGIGKGPSGAYTDGITVGWQTTSGPPLSGSVFVPKDQYGAAQVHAMVSESVAQMAAVANLTHTSQV